jgi:hypothetical protein
MFPFHFSSLWENPINVPSGRTLKNLVIKSCQSRPEEPVLIHLGRGLVYENATLNKLY